MELFEMRPINFLVKPLSNDKIIKIIDKFLLLNKVDTELFEFKSGHSFYKIPFADILYFCSNGRKIKIVTQNTEYEFYGSLDTVYNEIKNKKFLFVHKSFIANFRYITKYQYEQIIMSDNKIIPVSQSRRKAIRSIFLKTKEAELL
jgi:DNA-binding LytR/AlgR family response regulator